jgi:AcrR family transcriptional regulator
MATRRSTRQLRADDTRARLFAAAAELFTIRGYHDTSVDAIAKRAGVAKGTFFVHFATKDVVILQLLERQSREARETRAAALARGEGPLAALRASVMTLAAQASRSRELCRAVLEAMLENANVSGDGEALFGPLFVEMRDDARAAVAAGELGRGRDGELLARALVTSYLGATFYFASSRRSPPLLELLTPLVDANIDGFRAPARAPARRRRPPARRPKR